MFHDVYGTGDLQPEKLSAVREERHKIHRCVQELAHSEQEGFIIEYYLNFLDLRERMSFLDGIGDGKFQVSHKFVETIYHCPECRGNFEGGECINSITTQNRIARQLDGLVAKSEGLSMLQHFDYPETWSYEGNATLSTDAKFGKNCVYFPDITSKTAVTNTTGMFNLSPFGDYEVEYT